MVARQSAERKYGFINLNVLPYSLPSVGTSADRGVQAVGPQATS